MAPCSSPERAGWLLTLACGRPHGDGREVTAAWIWAETWAKELLQKKHNDFNLRQMTGKKPIPDGLKVRQFPMISEVGGRP
jgi:hypothetical protein